MCGGLSVAIHGFVRATVDINLLIRQETLEKAYKIAATGGFDIRGLDISFKERAVEIRRVAKIDDEGEVLSLDFSLSRPGSKTFGRRAKRLIFKAKNSPSCLERV